MSSHPYHPWLGGLAVLWAVTAQAQAQRIPGIELERLQLNPGARDSLVLSTGDLMSRGEYRLGFTGHYEKEPLVLVSGGEQQGVIVSNRVTVHLSGAYAITDWLELGAQVPIVSQWGPDTAALGVATPSTSALGTPWVQARAGILSEQRGGLMDLGLHLGAALPIGSTETLTRDQGFVFSPRLGLGKQLGGTWRVGADLGALVRTKTYALSPNTQPHLDEQGTELNGGVNLSAGLLGFRQELVVRGTLPVADAPESMEVLLGVRVPMPAGTEVYAMGGPGFGSTPGTPSFRVLAGLTFGTPASTPNACVEGQPHDPARCPDFDLDGDGIKNAADHCPTVEGLSELNGCPDGDDDGDGLPNLADRCPKEAENFNGFEDQDGCPDDPDTDGDGISDAKDQCPDQAEDKDGFQDEDGCPDPDNDNDGVLDTADRCPNEAGPKENRGCPDKDTDGDGIVDRLDNCPTEPGPAKNHGCKEKQLAQIGENRIQLLEAVYFENNKDIIIARSNKLLDTVANILIAHPEVEKVRVEGHTDNRGNPDYNLDLSQRRADAVVRYLVSKGVARERLDAKGFGPTQPIADNNTTQGRAKNRRVEFKIVGDAEGVQTQQGEPSPDTH
ncbi:OmpA family protein [Myxococcus xanthus]|nr:Peptidoglycan-associated lipoprotein [Myxococcus xanthus]SDX53699.1 Thrombospondin type 3 repeat-containing protein [Myxococcus xanthus]